MLHLTGIGVITDSSLYEFLSSVFRLFVRLGRTNRYRRVIRLLL